MESQESDLDAIIEQTTQVFVFHEVAMSWLHAAQMFLDHKRPIELAATMEGSELVRVLLVRIDCGVYT